MQEYVFHALILVDQGWLRPEKSREAIAPGRREKNGGLGQSPQQIF